MIKIKCFLISLLQLLLVSLLWLVVMAERLMTSALERTMNYIMSARSLGILKSIVEIRKADDRQVRTDKAVSDILFVLDKRNNRLLNIDRKTFEGTEAGCRARRQSVDRHLYAVLRPTRAENLKRIENVLRAMTPDALQRVHKNASKSMQLFV